MTSLMVTTAHTKGITWQHLSDRGFDFRYFTEVAESEMGEVTYFCFDIGYSIREDVIKLIRHPKYRKLLKAK